MSNEQCYLVTVSLIDNGKSVVWDDMPCYATSPEEAAKKTLAGYTAKAKARIVSIVDESGVAVA